jgi:hypothetical protein
VSGADAASSGSDATGRPGATAPNGVRADDGVAAETLRELVREVLRDVLRNGPLAVAQADRAAQDDRVPAGEGVQAVRLGTDDELQAFVLRILRLADNPRRRRDLLAGRLRFTLAAGQGDPVPAITQRVDKGAVTERAVIAAARAGAGLLLGPRAVLTPLAKDKARALGVRVEKER